MAVTNFKNSSIITGTKRTRVWDQSSAPGNFYSIATNVVGSGGVSTVEFSSIPQTYTHLQLRCSIVTNQSVPSIRFNLNSDTGSNYSWHSVYGDGASVGVGAGSSQAFMYLYFGGNSTSPSNNIVDILDYTNTNKFKTIKVLEGFDANGSGYTALTSGNWRSNSAITSIKFDIISPKLINQYSSFALYGVL